MPNANTAPQSSSAPSLRLSLRAALHHESDATIGRLSREIAASGLSHRELYAVACEVKPGLELGAFDDLMAAIDDLEAAS